MFHVQQRASLDSSWLNHDSFVSAAMFCPINRGIPMNPACSRLGTSLNDQTGLQKDMVDYFRRIVTAEETAMKNRATSAHKAR